MIKVNNLSKEFHEQGTSNELLAVDHVDFTIQNGSFCALVGESGSGKSTLAQLMCGLLVPSSGEVLFEGKNISLCRGKQKQVLRSKIQLILQDGKGAMDPRFTVYQIIAEPIRNFRKLSKKEEEREINGGSFDPATDMSNMAPGAMGDPILCQFSAFFENPEIFAELDSTSDSQRVQEIYGMILNGIADQNLLVPVTGTHDLALWNTDKITGYDFYTDASYVDIASVHVK